MKLKFLCANHREWLNHQPEQAIHCCSNATETGWFLYQQEQWEEALPFVGCAFETAEILLRTRTLMPAVAIQWFLQAQSGLSNTLLKLGHIEPSKHIYRLAIARLRIECHRDAALKSGLDAQIHRLVEELKCLDGCECVTSQQSMPMPQKQLKRVFH